MSQSEIIPVSGPFSLRAGAEFGFGPNAGRPSPFDGRMRLAFPVDGGRGYAGAVLRQAQPDGPVEVELELAQGGDGAAAVAQIARVLSLDHDGTGFARVGAADPVIGALQRAHPGQRPVLFHSPYEGAAWAIISARRSSAQAARVRTAMSEQLGASFELQGRTLHAFPQPDRLLDLDDSFAALNPEKVTRLHGVAQAALEGRLDAPALQALGPDQAYEELQRLKGLGPFYAGLVVLRATGFADAMLPMSEPKVLAHAVRFYEVPAEPDPGWFMALSERWRPYRTWATVLIRLAGDRGTAVVSR
jgi:DNA-3-methyladenine glycosylase II